MFNRTYHIRNERYNNVAIVKQKILFSRKDKGSPCQNRLVPNGNNELFLRQQNRLTPLQRKRMGNNVVKQNCLLL